MTKFFKTTLLAACVAGAGAASAADFTLKFSTMGAPTAPLIQCHAIPMLEAIKEASGGRIDYETYLGGTAFANPVKQYEQVARGVTDISEGPLTYTPGRFALTEIATVPFIGNDNVAVSIAMTRLAPEWLAEEFEDVKLMGVIMTTPYQMHFAKPIEDFTKLDGMRLRVSGPGLTGTVKTFNGEPASMPLPETYEAMQRGVIDGVIAPWTAVPSFNLHEVSTYHVAGDLSFGLTFLGMSKKFYDSLPADLQAIMDEKFIGEDIAAKGARCFQKIDAAAIKLASEQGNEIVQITDEQKAAAQEQLQPVVQAIIEDVAAKGLPAQEFYDALTAEIAKVEAELASN